jgi:hypothetical protein
VVAALFVGVLLTSVGCGSTGPAESVVFPNTDDDEFFLFPEPEPRDGSGESDIVLDWIDRELDLIQREQLSAPVAARVLAYTSLALDSAISLANGSDPLDIRGLELPDPPSARVDAGAAATVAISMVTQNLVPTPDGLRQSELLERKHLEQLTSQTDLDLGPSIQLGTDVAAAVVARAAGDGYDLISTDFNGPEPVAGVWRPTPPVYALAIEPEWGRLDPLVVSDTDCPVPDPVDFSEMPGSPFWDQAMVPFEASSAITDQQKQIVRHWSDRTGLTFTPAGHWVHILGAQTEADQESGTVPLADAARQFAVLSIVQSDVFIANFGVKYGVMLERPVTYIQRLADPDWLPFLPTPPHPEYPSGHSAGSAAAAVVLADMLGERSFTDTVHDRIGWESQSYTSFAEAADEASKSRIHAGIHYPMATEAGAGQGACIAATALERFGVDTPGR